MALRKIITEENEILRKVSKVVTRFDESLWDLLDDMKETLIKSTGVGLAAPQVGILKRIIVIDFGECRKGSIYFDLAAVITSLLSSTEDKNVIDKYIDIFVQTYSEYNISLNRNTLSKYFQLWFVRGILANTLEENYQIGKSEKAINYFGKQMKKICNINNI